MNFFCFKISFLSIAIPGCDSKILTISMWPFFEAFINGVILKSLKEMPQIAQKSNLINIC